MPPEAVPVYYTRLVNQTLRTDYPVAAIREMLKNEVDREDIMLALELREVLVQRMHRALKHPDAKKNLDGTLLLEMLHQLL